MQRLEEAGTSRLYHHSHWAASVLLVNRSGIKMWDAGGMDSLSDKKSRL
jgi:hypothetical protein